MNDFSVCSGVQEKENGAKPGSVAGGLKKGRAFHQGFEKEGGRAREGWGLLPP